MGMGRCAGRRIRGEREALEDAGQRLEVGLVEPAEEAVHLGLVLGPQLEENFRRAMLLSDGDFLVFVRHPISAALLGVAALLILVLLSPTVLKKRKEALAE